jgi:endonuclease III
MSTIIDKKKRAQKILQALKKLFPKPKMALRYSNNWELLVSVILSAQCTDKKVNEVTKLLFKKYTTFDAYLKAKVREFEKDIKSTGFYRSKAKNILTSAKMIKEKHNGRVPKSMDELLALPGVARKTANIVLGNAFGIVEGVAVDTHVKRLSHRFGLTRETSPEKIELDLMHLFPKKEWFTLTYRLIEYGRVYCSARSCPPDHPLKKFDS